jgi:hypothetical protein
MRRGSANFRFACVYQVAYDDIKNSLNNDLIDDFSDDTHIIIKARSFYRKLPLHNGTRFNHILDVKLLATSYGNGVFTSPDAQSILVEGHNKEDVRSGGIFGSIITTNFYNHPSKAPVTIINYVNDGANGGDKEIYLFIHRDILLGTLGFSKEAATVSSSIRGVVRASIQVDFVDGSSVPVVMEIKRMPIITLNDDTAMNQLQIGTLPPGRNNWMEFSPQVRGNAGYQGLAIPYVLYSFMRYGTPTASEQNPDIAACGTGTTANPYALPAYRLIDDAYNYGSTPFGSGTDRGTAGFSWISGTSDPFINGDATARVNELDFGKSSRINLGQFFEMDRVDAPTNNGAVYGDISNLSWGRKYGTINFFSANLNSNTAHPYNAWPDTEGNVDYGHGKGPTLGWAFGSLPQDTSGGQSRAVSLGYDVQAGKSPNIWGSSMYAPRRISHVQDILAGYGTPAEKNSVAEQLLDPQHNRGFFSSPSISPYPGGEATTVATTLKDLKTSYFQQVLSVGGGLPIVTCARVTLVPKNGVSTAVVDTAAFLALTNAQDYMVTHVNGGGGVEQVSNNVACLNLNSSGVDGIRDFHPKRALFTFQEDTVYTNDTQGLSNMFLVQGNRDNFHAVLTETTEAAKFANMPVNGIELIANAFFGEGQLYSIDTNPNALAAPEYNIDGDGGQIVGRLRGMLATESPETVGGLNGTHPLYRFKVEESWGGGVHPVMDVYGGGGSTFIANSTDTNWQYLLFGNPFNNVQVGTSAGDRTLPKASFTFSGYQDVYFINSLSGTTQKTLSPSAPEASLSSSMSPAHASDVYMAETGDYYKGPSTGEKHGTYHVPADTTLSSGGLSVYNYDYQDNFNSFLTGTASKVWHMAHAFSDNAICKCTDVTLQQGRDNISNTVVPSGYYLDPLPVAESPNQNYWNSTLNYTPADFNEGREALVYYTGVAGPSTSTGGAEPCVYATGVADCLEFISSAVEVSDLEGGFEGGGNGLGPGFKGITVKFNIRYRNNCSGTGSANFKSGSDAAPTALADILSIWDIQYIPGNAGQSSNVSDATYFNYAIPITVEDAEDIHSLEIVDKGNNVYELKGIFTNTENFLTVTSLTQPVQVFPDLPYLRKMPGGDYPFVTQATTDVGASLNPSDITLDAFRSNFFNHKDTGEGAASSPAITGGAKISKFITESHTGLDGIEDSGNSYIPYRSSRIIVSPKNATYASEGKRIFDFVTYGTFRELSGCTDPNAVNYNPNAIQDDGTCIDSVFGCTDPLADNYDAAANTDDGSCTYCTTRLNILSGSDGTRPIDTTAITNVIAGNTGNYENFFGILAGYNYNATFSLGDFNGVLGTVTGGLSGEVYFNQLGSDFPAYAPDYYYALRRTGVPVSRTSTPLSTTQYGPGAPSASNTQTLGHELDISVIFPFVNGSLVGEGDATTDFENVVTDVSNHKLRIYAATDTLISFITDNNANTGTSTISQELKFIAEDSNGNPGYSTVNSQSSLEAAGFIPLATINGALSTQFPTYSSTAPLVAKFRISGPSGAQTTATLTTDTLYVVEYIVTDKECADNINYPAFYTYTMLGRCGCVDLTNQNAPTSFPWQVDGVNSFPVAHDGTDCVDTFSQGPGDSGQLCFALDNELKDCTSLYEYCLVSSTTQCLENEVTSIEDPDLIESGGQYFYPSETVVIVQIDGIYNPTTNTYEFQNQNTGEVSQYLNYTITPTVTYTDGTVEILTSAAQGQAQGDVAANGIQHTFVFNNVSSYQFSIEFINPPSDSGIYQGHTAGPLCIQELVGADIIFPEGNCEIIVGCTDPIAINYDPNATLAGAEGTCQYSDCEEIFISDVGGYSLIEPTTTNATVTCATITETVLGVEITNSYPVVNANGTMTVKVTTDTADFPEFVGTTEAQIAIAPANIIGMPGIQSESDLVFMILNQAVDVDFATNGGTIPIVGSNTPISVSKKQIIDVPVAGGVATDFVNRSYDETVADASGNGYLFENLAPGEYFVFVFPPQADLFGSDLANTLGCTNEAFYYLDNVTRSVVGLTDADPPCEEDCGNPAGCNDEVYGCTDPDNVEYDPFATIDDGSCVPNTGCDDNSTDPACFDCQTEFAERIIGGIITKADGVVDPCDPTTEGEGCTDPNACNYDPFIDASNSNNQLCDYCSCNPNSVDCCEGEDCGCDPEVDEDCAPPPPPPCPDPTNPDCDTDPPVVCYDPAECPPPNDPCVVLGNCPEGDPGGDDGGEEDPIIETFVPISVPCEPLVEGPGLTFEEVQNAIMSCHGTAGSKLLLKMKAGINYDDTDLIKLDLISYLFLGGMNKTALPCLFNCNYETTTKFDKYTAKERWALTGGKRWARSNAYRKGEIVAYYYNTYGQTKRAYFQAIRDVEAEGKHPKYKDSGWKLVSHTMPMTKDPLGIATGEEEYLVKFFEFYRRFCDSCEVAPDTKVGERPTAPKIEVGITKNVPRGLGGSSIIGPDGEEIIF